MKKQLEKIGILDSTPSRNYLNNHLIKEFKNTNNIVSTKNGFITKESLLMGPNGGVKIESIWYDNNLITIIIKN